MKKQPEITEATRNTFTEAFCELYKTTPIENRKQIKFSSYYDQIWREIDYEL